MARTFVRPTIVPVVKKPVVKKYALTLDSSLLSWEREVYENDPTGGAPSAY